MLKLQTILELTKCQIIKGSTSDRTCYGDEIHSITFTNFNNQNDKIILNCIIETRTQQVMELELINKNNNKLIKWVDKYYRDDYKNEVDRTIKKASDVIYECYTLNSKGKMLKLIEIHFKS